MIFWLTVNVGADIHPLRAVTVYVYIPGVVTCMDDWLEITAPVESDHTPVAPGVLIVPINKSSGIRQLRVPAPPTNTSGESVFCVTVAVAVEVQALGAVTVSVYTPASETTGLYMVDIKLLSPTHNHVTF